MRIVYMGTPDFAVPALEKIVSCGWDVPLVVTKPDRPASRGHKIQQCDVKKKALELGLAVESPEKVKNNPEFAARLREIAPDFIVVAAYGKILPKEILDIPAYGCINIHGSLLPKYRGAAPIQRSVLAGDPESGVTIMYMAEECDAGDMLAQRAIPIAGKTSEQVFDELSVLGADLLVECLPKIVSGELKGVPQDASLATHAAMIAKPKILVISIGQDGLMGVDKETFIANYESLVMGIREKSPGTYIVCCSVTSVGANYAGADGLTRDAINWANDYIQEVCIDTGAYFCDVAHDMRDSTSVLDGSYASSNGKTLNTAGLNAFLQYLRTHMVEG